MKNNIKTNLLILLIYSFIFLEFNMFGLALIPVILFLDLEFKLSKIQKYLLILGPIAMYLKIFISSTSEKLNNLWISSAASSFQGDVRFGDLQLVLTKLKCNFFGEGYVYDVKFSDFIGSCPFNVGYGPFFSYIEINTNIWNLTLILSVLFVSLFIYSLSLIVKFNDKNFILYSVLIISPPVVFLIMRMNLDIFIFAAIFIFLHKFGENSYRTLALLTFLSFAKIYPIFLMFIILFLKVLTKNFSYFIWYLISSISTLSLIFYDGVLFTDRSVRPSISNMSFGVLTYSQNIWVDFLNRYGGFRYVLLIFLLLVLIILFISYIIFNNKNLIIELSKEEFLLISFYLSVFLYANYDYRLTLLIFGITPFMKKGKHSLRKLVTVLFLLSPLPIIEIGLIYNFLIILKVLINCFIAALLIANIYSHLFKNHIE